jgi:hypothetical protein
MVKRKVVDAETGKEVEGDGSSVPEPVVKRFGSEQVVKARPTSKKSKVRPLKKATPEPPEPVVEAPPPVGNYVELICLRPSRRNETGRVTKNKYVFEGGEPVPVDVRDVEYLKAARRGSRSSGEVRIFVEPGEI